MIVRKLSRAKVQQADFWPELSHPGMVSIARIAYTTALPGARPELREDARQAAPVGKKESPLGIYGDNRVTNPKNRGVI